MSYRILFMMFLASSFTLSYGQENEKHIASQYVESQGIYQVLGFESKNKLFIIDLDPYLFDALEEKALTDVLRIKIKTGHPFEKYSGFGHAKTPIDMPRVLAVFANFESLANKVSLDAQGLMAWKAKLATLAAKDPKILCDYLKRSEEIRSVVEQVESLGNADHFLSKLVDGVTYYYEWTKKDYKPTSNSSSQTKPDILKENATMEELIARLDQMGNVIKQQTATIENLTNMTELQDRVKLLLEKYISSVKAYVKAAKSTLEMANTHIKTQKLSENDTVVLLLNKDGSIKFGEHRSKCND